MANPKSQMTRLEIPYFNGINCLVANNLTKKTELFYAENVRSETIGTFEKRKGFIRLGNSITSVGNYGMFDFKNSTATSTGFYRICKVGSTTSVYHLNTSAAWTALAGAGTSLTAPTSTTSPLFYDMAQAEGCCFLVNSAMPNRYISADGTTVVTSATSTGHLYNSPNANKINYYKDRLYVGDYTATTRHKTGIMMSSVPLGLISLVDGDSLAVANGDVINVTDTKYIQAVDSLDVYRGNLKIADLTTSSKTENSITINAVTMAGSYTDFNSSDEIWVDGTFTGTKIFRWAGNPASGTDEKRYDTFKLSGSQSDRIKMMTNIGDVMILSNNSNMNFWNDSALKALDVGIGCVSDQGYVKALGKLYFLHYSGIYSIGGAEMPTLISSKIEPYITGASKTVLQSSAAGRKGLSVFWSLSSTTLYYPDGSVKKTLSNVILEYNIRTTDWFVHSGIKATSFATYQSSSNADRLQFESTETGYHVQEFLKGQLDDDSTDDRAIISRADTGLITLNKSFENIAQIYKVIVECERGSAGQVFISLDGGNFYELEGMVKKGCNILTVHNKDRDNTSPPRARMIEISLRDSSKKLCKISRLAIIYKFGDETEEYKEISFGT